MSRIHVDLPLASGDVIELPERTGRYLTQVLRLANGDAFRIFNGDGRDFTAELDRRGRTLCVRIGQAGPKETPPVLEIALWIGISRGERMDLAIQKAVELGVHHILPLFTERSQVRLDDDRRKKRLQHWRGVVISACEQSGRRRVPAVEPPGNLAPALSRHRGTGLLLAPDAPTALSGLPSPGPRLALLVGPEGGLSMQERGLAERSGFIPVRLGPRVLRTETAPLAALAAVQTLWGDFRD